MTTNTKPVALVTGPNKGIGHQIANDFDGHSFTVLIGPRNLSNGETAEKNIGPNAIAPQLDITNPLGGMYEQNRKVIFHLNLSFDRGMGVYRHLPKQVFAVAGDDNRKLPPFTLRPNLSIDYFNC